MRQKRNEQDMTGLERAVYGEMIDSARLVQMLKRRRSGRRRSGNSGWRILRARLGLWLGKRGNRGQTPVSGGNRGNRVRTPVSRPAEVA